MPEEPNPPDLDSLVRRYLDLWQEQWAALAADPELADALSRWFGTVNQGVFGSLGGGTFMGFADAMKRTTATPGEETGTGTKGDGARRNATKSSETARAPAAQPSSRDGTRDLAQLEKRLALLDERLAALEAGTFGGGDKPPKKPRRRRSRSA